MNGSRLRVLMFLLGGVTGVAQAQTCPPNNPAPIALDNRYTVSESLAGEFVVADTQTGLIWKQCAEGRSGVACATGSLMSHTWSAALILANGSTHAGFSDWRLPSINELYSLVETSCFSPSINSVRFPASGNGPYWSASTYSPNDDFAWGVSFLGGISNVSFKTDAGSRVRLVRGGQSLDSFAAEADFIPDSFSFTAQIGVPLNSPRMSNSIGISGISTPVGIAVSGASGSAYSINSGAFTAAPGSVVNGNTVVVSHTSSGAIANTLTTTLSIGAMSATFVSTTAGANTPPTFTPAAAISRQQGSLGIAGLIVGTASDAETAVGSLSVTQITGGTAVGVSATSIVNSVGAISAAVEASCTATPGTLRFQADDGSLMGAGDLQITISTNAAPVLTYAASTNFNLGADSTISPATGPGDNGTVSAITVLSFGTYSGGISVNGSTGVITLTSTAPAGAHSITIRATDQCGLTTDASFTLTINNTSSALPTPLNDSGQIACYNAATSTGTVSVATPDPEGVGFDEQDCTRGRAAADAVGALRKLGDSGVRGRDYTKIANDGSGLPANALLGGGADDWGCTRDNVTRLIWEVKTNNNGLRDRDHTYTWFDADTASNGSNPGSTGSNTCNNTLPSVHCNTTAFRDAVNALSGGSRLCGANDWRLPTGKELESLGHYVGGLGTRVDAMYFPNMLASDYWSGVSLAASADKAWMNTYLLCCLRGELKTSSKNVLLVRDGP